MKMFFSLNCIKIYFLCISTKVVKAALAMGGGFGDPKYNSSLNELLSDALR